MNWLILKKVLFCFAVGIAVIGLVGGVIAEQSLPIILFAVLAWTSIWKKKDISTWIVIFGVIMFLINLVRSDLLESRGDFLDLAFWGAIVVAWLKKQESKINGN